ncbi:MAG: hypothetical protein JWM19_5544 [Actinomycetia bacterium]|nr:hypothetical protein [Actinomycetes bacterium]
MLTGFLGRTLPVAAAALAAVTSTACAAGAPDAAATAAPGASAASPAATPGWRIVKMLHIVQMGGLSVRGTRDAWLAGDSCADAQCDRDTVIVRHWDGTAWRVVPSPKAVTAFTDDAGVGAVAASSASNAWVFSTRGSDVTDTTALHWTGKGWAPPVRLAADIDTAVTLSASDTWAFGAPASDPQAGYIAHFDGRTWSRGSFPVQVTDASALSASDIWAGGVQGAAADESAVIEHWNGKAWRETPLPSLGIATGSWIGMSVTAVTPRDVWAEVGTQGDGTQGSYLLHWNGNAWARVTLSCPGSVTSPVAPDGHGGVWVASAVASSAMAWFCHDADGHWTKTLVPRHAGEQPGIDSLAWIPGTRSLWAAGGFDADAGEAILKYGP